MNYWQVAAGEGTRDFSDVFLQYGVILMGSGHLGSFSEHPENYEGKKDWRRKIVTLAKSMDRGDVVVMKKRWGTKGAIVAAGRVISDYEFLGPFDDVEGWDMSHGRKVNWFQPDSPIDINGLARGTVSRIHNSHIQNEAYRLLEEGNEFIASEIPTPAKGMHDEGLVERLIGNGLRPGDAETVIQTIRHVRRLAGWYASRGRDLSEHEIRTFLIIPLLLALGWSEQRIKIEWKQTDIAMFKDVYAHNAHPEVILESKRMGTGMHYALAQAQKYAKQFPDCSKLVTSTGGRYQLYTKSNDQNWHVSAYLNLLKLKDRHPYLANVGGAPELFMTLMPR